MKLAEYYEIIEKATKELEEKVEVRTYYDNGEVTSILVNEVEIYATRDK